MSQLTELLTVEWSFEVPDLGMTQCAAGLVLETSCILHLGFGVILGNVTQSLFLFSLEEYRSVEAYLGS